MKIKSKLRNGKIIYILCGDDPSNEIAGFPSLLQCALVCRYLSGCEMAKNDSKNALAAIAEFDDLVDLGKAHFESVVKANVQL